MQVLSFYLWNDEKPQTYPIGKSICYNRIIQRSDKINNSWSSSDRSPENQKAFYNQLAETWETCLANMKTLLALSNLFAACLYNQYNL